MKTCSKENGARLQELGVTVPSYFVWALGFEGGSSYITERNNSILIHDVVNGMANILAPAYTAGELLEILKLIDRKVCIHNAIEGWLCGANLEYTLAERVIYLIEHDHITVEEINEHI